LLAWPEGYPKDINDLYLKNPDSFRLDFDSLVTQAKAVAKPILKVACDDFEEILNYCKVFSENRIVGIPTGYPKIDAFTGGLRGIDILGGPPKIGKSMLATTIAANVAELGYPVIYCDFENGIHKIRLRILSRLSHITVMNILLRPAALTTHERFECIKERFLNLAQNLFIHRPSLRDFLKEEEKIPDSTDILFRKYVQCIREEFGREKRILIIIDSLQKLPLWNISDRRSNIDTWLRSFEKIRDEFDVSFLIISELSRGTYDDASIDSFKESGDIEYTADLAMQIRKDKDERGDEVIELHAVANRDGETGIIATYKPLYTRCDFEELPNNIFREEIKNDRKGR
jgi:replicative DNA helicase